MPKILAIDTTGEVCSLALYDNPSLWTYHQPLPRQHARQVLPRLEALITEAGWHKKDIDFVVYGRGPGSFTGIRIAAGIAQGIALGIDCGVMPISTLQTLAFESRALEGEENWVALDARMQELYFARYRKNEAGVPILQGSECLLKPSDLPRPEPGICLSGNGWQTNYGFSGHWQALIENVTVQETLPSAAWAAQLADRLVASDPALVRPPELALPVYLRDNVTWDKKPRIGS